MHAYVQDRRNKRIYYVPVARLPDLVDVDVHSKGCTDRQTPAIASSYIPTYISTVIATLCPGGVRGEKRPAS